MDILKCIQKVYPDWKGMVRGNEYAGIVPHEIEARPIPTLAELEIAWIDVEKEMALQECYARRVAAYPPLADYLDAIVKGDEAQKQAYIDACLAVKVRYPKP